MGMKLIIVVIVVVLLFVAYSIKASQDLNLKKFDDQKVLFKNLSGWVVKVVKNIKEVTGYALKQDWLPKTFENRTK